MADLATQGASGAAPSAGELVDDFAATRKIDANSTDFDKTVVSKPINPGTSS
jgi:hypothetical protein